ncbi:MAG TPA: hypothetical protein PLF44_04780 [Candidatus Mcinerneyibacteriales bacterium]|nr:hypothetical protein [Candidatus Mcinerneyibacteriales bacterium]HPE20837.1 hypothetical protein [Candidatus Mcinerneyibacteriales bacterium]HPJ70175.1 hypothetical protein [Candidatus Mcinerneyibacteriales bacterium]HPQ89689.1 hypothetical protein [Candidatus Mcinerneyibacteriales bacterium]
MRTDKFLQLSRILKQRSTAKEVCEAGHVWRLQEPDGFVTLKAASEVHEGDRIRIQAYNKILVLEISEIPQTKNVSKQKASSLYKTISEEVVEG